MVVISKSQINKFCKNHTDAEDAVMQWYYETKLAEWKSFHEIKKTFNSVDAVGNDRYVFNIRGNKYRLIALIFFSTRTVYIRFIGTHVEYNKIDVTTI